MNLWERKHRPPRSLKSRARLTTLMLDIYAMYVILDRLALVNFADSNGSAEWGKRTHADGLEFQPR